MLCANAVLVMLSPCWRHPYRAAQIRSGPRRRGSLGTCRLVVRVLRADVPTERDEVPVAARAYTSRCAPSLLAGLLLNPLSLTERGVAGSLGLVVGGSLCR